MAQPLKLIPGIPQLCYKIRKEAPEVWEEFKLEYPEPVYDNFQDFLWQRYRIFCGFTTTHNNGGKGKKVPVYKITPETPIARLRFLGTITYLHRGRYVTDRFPTSTHDDFRLAKWNTMLKAFTLAEYRKVNGTNPMRKATGITKKLNRFNQNEKNT